MKTRFLIFSMIVIFSCNNSYAQDHVCDGSLWRFVYHPDRLTVHQQCLAVTGTVDHIVKEADGDYHIRLKLDPGQTKYLNATNRTRQHGCLVLEIICVNRITQLDAKQPCKNCPKYVTIPKKGQHIKAVGTYITDTEGGHGWNEIHPVYDIELLDN